MYPYRPGLYPTCSQFHGLYLTDLTSVVKTPKSQLQTKVCGVDKMSMGKIFGWVRENSKVKSPSMISKVKIEIQNIKSFTCSTTAYEVQFLHKLLLRNSSKGRLSKTLISQSHKQTEKIISITSHYRKLKTSEIPCKRRLKQKQCAPRPAKSSLKSAIAVVQSPPDTVTTTINDRTNIFQLPEHHAAKVLVEFAALQDGEAGDVKTSTEVVIPAAELLKKSDSPNIQFRQAMMDSVKVTVVILSSCFHNSILS